LFKATFNRGFRQSHGILDKYALPTRFLPFFLSQKLQAFAGMDPKVTQSGQFVGTDNKISKRGSPYPRRAVYIAANIAKIHDPIFKEHYDRLVVRGKHLKQAFTAVAAKLLRVIHAVMVKQVPYTPAILSGK
jgi:hypothetical protein